MYSDNAATIDEVNAHCASICSTIEYGHAKAVALFGSDIIKPADTAALNAVRDK